MGNNRQKRKTFSWDNRKTQVALDLADGISQLEAAARAGVCRQSITKWLHIPEFKAEVDRLTMMAGIAAKAERLLLIKRVVRKQIQSELSTNRDLLDWLKFAKSETDGVNLGMTALLERAGRNCQDHP